MKNKYKYLLAFSPLLLSCSFIIFAGIRYQSIKNAIPAELQDHQEIELENFLDVAYARKKNRIQPLPYQPHQPELEIAAESAILINADTGFIIFEKDADRIIPPASMTKLFLMYSVFKKINQGKTSLDAIIPIDSRSYAANMPPHSSLMFLGKGQTVTLKELLTGLSVSSGNDAAYAIAYALFDTMENFIEEINKDIKELGLKNTRIVESSGYSELNLTTAREMALFSKIYIETFPQALEMFHAIKDNTYPKQENLPLNQRNLPPQTFKNGIPEKIWTPVTQKNTNSLLGILEGCDGIKTGHIIESGYNLSLTSKRNDTRFISITMLGPGMNMKEGDMYRVKDGLTMHEWAYKSYRVLPAVIMPQVTVPVFASKQKAIKIKPAYSQKLLLPLSESMEKISNTELSGKIKISAEYPAYLNGKINMGEEYGKITVTFEDNVIQQIPLVADRNTDAESGLIRSTDNILMKLTSKKRM